MITKRDLENFMTWLQNVLTMEMPHGLSINKVH